MNNLSQELKNCLILEEEARQMGCARAALIWSGDVVFDPRVSLKCAQNLCTHYGRNFMCPPFVPAAREFSGSAARYRIALLLQQEKEIGENMTAGEMNGEFKKMALDLLGILVALEKRAFALDFPFSMGLGGGECKICEDCGAKSGQERCSRPGEARPSMEAAGIDVLGTCQRANFPSKFERGLIRSVGLLFIT